MPITSQEISDFLDKFSTTKGGKFCKSEGQFFGRLVKLPESGAYVPFNKVVYTKREAEIFEYLKDEIIDG